MSRRNSGNGSYVRCESYSDGKYFGEVAVSLMVLDGNFHPNIGCFVVDDKDFEQDINNGEEQGRVSVSELTRVSENSGVYTGILTVLKSDGEEVQERVYINEDRIVSDN